MSSRSPKTPKDPRTIAAAKGVATDKTFGAVVPPLYLTSTFAFSGFEKSRPATCSPTRSPSSKAERVP